MKNSQSGMARNWNDEGELFDDPLDDEEYADTQAMEAWLEELEERAIHAERKRKKNKYCGIGGVKDESNQSDQRVFSDRGREGLFLRAFGKRNIR